MVGPKTLLQSEHENFLSFCTSLSLASTPNSEGSHRPEGSAKSSTDRGFAWKAPNGWVKGSEQAMRLVTYQLGSKRNTECYITVLPGKAGGVGENINRWRKQMGNQPMKSETLSALSEIQILNQNAKIAEIKGNYTGMDSVTKKDFMMQAAVCELPNNMLFIKMVGPQLDVEKERGNFLQFCASIHRH